MNRDVESLEAREAIDLPEDFAERVLQEVERRRTRTRRLRAVGTGLALVAVIAVAGRIPGRLVRQLVHHHPVAPALALADYAGEGSGDGPATGTDDPFGEGAGLDPVSLFVPGVEGESPAPDTADDPDSDLLVQE